jgi:peroxiredoxin
MMPTFQKLWAERKADGLDVIGVASDDNPGLVSEHVKALGVTYWQVVDATAAIRGDFHVAQVPHSVVIDRKGRVRLSLQGGKPEDLEKIVNAAKAALEEQP